MIEELQNIINDAETDYNKDQQNKRPKERHNGKHYLRYVQKINSNHQTNNHNHRATNLDDEMEIVPVKLVPHPPRRSRSSYCLEREYNGNNYQFFEDEDSHGKTDSMLSSSNETENIQPAYYCSQLQHHARYSCPSRHSEYLELGRLFNNLK